MKLHELRPNKDARRERRRLGRGMGSGRGKTAGKGTRANWPAPAAASRAPFIGGAFPLTRTQALQEGLPPSFPRRVSLDQGRGAERAVRGRRRGDGCHAQGGLASSRAGEKKPIKLLSDGEITKRLTVTVDRASAQARAKIEAAGGSLEETLARKSAATPGEEA